MHTQRFRWLSVEVETWVEAVLAGEEQEELAPCPVLGQPTPACLSARRQGTAERGWDRAGSHHPRRFSKSWAALSPPPSTAAPSQWLGPSGQGRQVENGLSPLVVVVDALSLGF